MKRLIVELLDTLVRQLGIIITSIQLHKQSGLAVLTWVPQQVGLRREKDHCLPQPEWEL